MGRYNYDAWQLWINVQTQWRSTAGGILGLDYTVVYAEAARLRIDLSNATMAKIRALERETLNVIVSRGE